VQQEVIQFWLPLLLQAAAVVLEVKHLVTPVDLAAVQGLQVAIYLELQALLHKGMQVVLLQVVQVLLLIELVVAAAVQVQ
jgi:hypothetical protein